MFLCIVYILLYVYFIIVSLLCKRPLHGNREEGICIVCLLGGWGGRWRGGFPQYSVGHLEYCYNKIEKSTKDILQTSNEVTILLRYAKVMF